MIVIRADGNEKIGMGHLMRCLTIADAVRELCKESNILFACADLTSSEIVAKRGYQVKVLNTNYQDMELELPFWTKWSKMQKELTESIVFLVDSYFVSDLYLEELKQIGKVVLLDDMAKHTFPADIVINYNAFAREEQYLKLYKDTQTKYFLGAAYVPIRQQFLNIDYQIKETAKNILITTGGSDYYNIAMQIIDRIYQKGKQYHIVIGAFHPYLQQWQQKAKEQQGIYIYYYVTEMNKLMEKCDAAITAGGTTIYELALVGVPFICFSYAENQEALTEYIGKNQIAGYAGAYHKNPKQTLENIEKSCFALFTNTKLRQQYFQKERQMIDGLGAKRLARILLSERKK